MSRIRTHRAWSTRSATIATTFCPGDVVVLIVENESMFARYLLDAVRDKGMKGITTSLGVTALALAAEYKPAAVTLDIHLPDIEGWRVLDRLKNDPQTRHVPVAVISTDEARDRALDSGAFTFLAKPVQSEAQIDALLDKVKQFVGRGERTLLAVSADPSRLEVVRRLPGRRRRPRRDRARRQVGRARR